MRKFAVLFYLLLCGYWLTAQNWNVFNKNYRYNYNFDGNAQITNVLFADTIQPSGADTIYSINKIGVICSSACAATTISPTPTIVFPNIPQFLQRKIKKFSNGTVMLFDTAKIVIIPTCTINQTWLFDSIYNKSATCINTSTQAIFGMADSVKTILVGGTDTVKLSKNFGLIVFPKLYAVNKYYRLAGIENKNSYDVNSLFGEKVPNAWDFYDFSVGDVFCFRDGSINYGLQYSTCSMGNYTITSKTTSSNSYSYGVSGYYVYVNINSNFPCMLPPPGVPFPQASYSTGISQFLALSSTTLAENRMYPGMIYTLPGAMTNNLVYFGKDASGRFYKYMGGPCSNAYTVTGQTNIQNLINSNNGYYYSGNGGYGHKMAYGVGLGEVQRTLLVFEYSGEKCVDYAKVGSQTYGSPIPLSVREYPGTSLPSSGVYPNPASEAVQLYLNDNCKVLIHDMLGKQVSSVSVAPGEKIDVSALPAGIYYLTAVNGAEVYHAKFQIVH